MRISVEWYKGKEHHRKIFAGDSLDKIFLEIERFIETMGLNFLENGIRFKQLSSEGDHDGK